MMPFLKDLAFVVHAAIQDWPKTLRLVLIILAVAIALFMLL
jgi:hypothetical protein